MCIMIKSISGLWGWTRSRYIFNPFYKIWSRSHRLWSRYPHPWRWLSHDGSDAVDIGVLRTFDNKLIMDMTAYLLIGEVVHGIADKIWKLPARSVKNDLFMRNIQTGTNSRKICCWYPWYMIMKFHLSLLFFRQDNIFVL